MMPFESSEPQAVLLFDGGCALCRASVRFVLAHERATTLCFASLDGPWGTALAERHPWIQCVDSVMWVEHLGAENGETILIKSDAVLRIARYLGGPWRMAVLARLVPRRIRDAVYDLVARHRHRIWGTTTECVVPVPKDRERFLD